MSFIENSTQIDKQLHELYLAKPFGTNFHHLFFQTRQIT